MYPVILVAVALGQGAAEGGRWVRICESDRQAVISIPAGASPIVRYAAELLQAGAEDLGARRPKIVEGSSDGAQLILATKPDDPCDPGEGYLVKRLGPQQVILTAGGDRGLLYGAARLADLALRREPGGVAIEIDGRVHRPALALRGNYTLACWGRTHLYTLDHWKAIFDQMARDSMNLDMFWLSGLFPSKKHPESIVYPQARLTLEDLRELVRHAHRRGMKFLIGTGVFAWFGVDAMAATHPESKAVGSGGMCPSGALARRLNREYILEMLDALPEADGLFLEIRDEYGPCLCQACQKPLDAHGSKQYGQAELSFLRELAAEVWRRRPKAMILSTIGYGGESKGAHTGDVLYYEGIRQMADPRLAWLVCRENWEFPAADGQAKPLAYFSDNMIQWRQYYRMPVAAMADWIRRTSAAGCRGFCPAFEPGFCTASWSSDEVPYPVDSLPYALTRLAYREYCWEPELAQAEFRARVLARFFGPDAPPQLADDLLALFEVIRRESQTPPVSGTSKWPRGCVQQLIQQAEKGLAAPGPSPGSWKFPRIRLAELCRTIDRCRPQVDLIESRLARLPEGLSPRARRTVGLMRRALSDTRAELALDPPWADRAKAAQAKVDQLTAQWRAVSRATAEATSEYSEKYAAFQVLDGDPGTSWLAKDRSPLPQSITVRFRQPQTIDYVRLVQGNYHRAYNTRAYRVEYTADGKTFSPLCSGELPDRPGAEQRQGFKPVQARAIRVLVLSVYPNLDYSAPSLAEIDAGKDER